MIGKILVVDDIRKNIQVLGNLLGKEGHAVSYAVDGLKALEMTQEVDFDLILLDVMMPEMDGFEVCRRLKESDQTRDIPVLFLTAKTEQVDIVFGLEQGAVDYLTKPVNAAELKVRVKTHLSLRQSQLQLQTKNRELKQKNKELSELLEENKRAQSEIKVLQGFLPICSHCKKIRNDKGYWMQMEAYIAEHSEARFSHGLCIDCARKHYPSVPYPENYQMAPPGKKRNCK